MFGKFIKINIWISFSLLVLLCSCASKNADNVRLEHTFSFTNELDQRTETELESKNEFKLSDCICIAEKNNLSILSAEINNRISGLERKISFSNFLPKVDLEAGYLIGKHTPTQKMRVGYAQVSDRHFSTSVVAAQQPIFVPYSWYLYRTLSKGEDISELVNERTCQLISLKITSLFYKCLTLEKVRAGLESAVKGEERLFSEINKYNKEGLILASELMEVEASLTYKRHLLSENDRLIERSMSHLLEAMGLDPFREINLVPGDKKEIVLPSLEELVIEALLNRPEMKLQDRRYEIEQDRVKIAITRFLPVVSVVGGFEHSTDSYVKYSSQWVGGVSGMMSLFNGFANINAYKAAKEKEKLSFIKREEACFMVMLQVQKAYQNVCSAQEIMDVVRKSNDAKKEKLREEKARYKEGLIRVSELLKAVAASDEAGAELFASEYNYRVFLAVLEDVVGHELLSEEKN
jgi:outer membrane protein TolC